MLSKGLFGVFWLPTTQGLNPTMGKSYSSLPHAQDGGERQPRSRRALIWGGVFASDEQWSAECLLQSVSLQLPHPGPSPLCLWPQRSSTCPFSRCLCRISRQPHHFLTATWTGAHHCPPALQGKHRGGPTDRGCPRGHRRQGSGASDAGRTGRWPETGHWGSELLHSQ